MKEFDNWLLWKLFGCKEDKVTERWRRLHDELYNMYYSSS
jgi:hypothetical protein